jgi:hypothetical protein
MQCFYSLGASKQAGIQLEEFIQLKKVRVGTSSCQEFRDLSRSQFSTTMQKFASAGTCLSNLAAVRDSLTHFNAGTCDAWLVEPLL